MISIMYMCAYIIYAHRLLPVARFTCVEVRLTRKLLQVRTLAADLQWAIWQKAGSETPGCVYTSGTRAQDHTQCIKNIYVPLYIRICIYIYILPIAYYLLPVACCILHIACCSGGVLLLLDLLTMDCSPLLQLLVRRYCGFCEGLFLKVSSFSTRIQSSEYARAHSINWLRDQHFEQGMTIYIYT